MKNRTEVSRRSFVGKMGLGIVGAATATTAVASCSSSDSPEDAGSGRSPLSEPAIIPFHGKHQPGVGWAPPAAGIAAAFDFVGEDRADLEQTMRTMSAEIKRVMELTPVEPRAGGHAGYDSGVLGDKPAASETSIIVGVGHSLFDDRFGLADRMPRELQPMPRFLNDFMVTQERSHGDLSVTVSADNNDAAIYAFRQVMRVTRGKLRLRWMQEGYNSMLPNRDEGEAPVRNLMGFRDGTSNPSGEQALQDFVWITDEHDEPDWAIGGTYQATRIIRMQVEFWDRTRLSEQEAIFGRHKVSGAALGQTEESEIPAFADDSSNVDVGHDMHIRRANPHLPETDKFRIVRRGFSYTNGFDENEQLDQGLLFQSYQRSIIQGFIAMQSRLDGEVLEEYIRPQGGGIFFVLPGVPDEDGYLGESLLA